MYWLFEVQLRGGNGPVSTHITQLSIQIIASETKTLPDDEPK